MPVRFGIPILAGGSEEIDNAVDLEKIADMTEKVRKSIFRFLLPAYQTRWPGVMLRFFGEISASEWMKKTEPWMRKSKRFFFSR